MRGAGGQRLRCGGDDVDLAANGQLEAGQWLRGQPDCVGAPAGAVPDDICSWVVHPTQVQGLTRLDG